MGAFLASRGVNMKLGLVLSTNDPETCWNVFRLGAIARGEGHNVKTFLVNRGVEIEGIKSEKFDVMGMCGKYMDAGGEMLACTTCLRFRHKEGSAACPLSSQKELLKMVEESDKVLTFG